MAPRNDRRVTRRKLITIDERTWQALDLLARDTGRSFQELADEALADLLKKNRRPVTLKEALRESARQQPANDGAKAQSKPKRRR